MAIKHARTTSFVFDNEDYYLAHLDDGGIRFGMKGYTAIQCKADHALYAELSAITEDRAETAYDNLIERGIIRIF